MQTKLDAAILNSHDGPLVESILRKCVHCGFCNATCPTYQLTGDELDGPRGRIYQMKQFFEGAPANVEMLKHLDRCLTCRSCESTCPSGVAYSQLFEVGREAVEQALPRPLSQRLKRWVIIRFINSRGLFRFSIVMGRALSRLMPGALRDHIPPKQTPIAKLNGHHVRKALMLDGCVQPALAPNTNIAASNVLNRLGVSTIELEDQQCCGAAALHTSQLEYGRTQIKRLIDTWWPHIEEGVEAIVVTATGCAVTVADYGRVLENDPVYAEKARKISSLFCELTAFLAYNIDKLELPNKKQHERVAFHSPCTMQHGLGIRNQVEVLLEHVGFSICQVEDAHLCCGSAGTYSILQPELSGILREDKKHALKINRPDIIATANIGCQLQLAKGNDVPVVHWIELINRALNDCCN